jgi:hypothetical protein
MGKYMYKIVIEREPQEIKYSREIELKDELLTLAELRKHVSENEYFSIDLEETDDGGFRTMLNVSGKRLETQDEVDIRVTKQEKYMENYHKFHGTEPT